ncbi:hypothetical protein D3C86_1330540 [compost metagenome]
MARLADRQEEAAVFAALVGVALEQGDREDAILEVRQGRVLDVARGVGAACGLGHALPDLAPGEGFAGVGREEGRDELAGLHLAIVGQVHVGDERHLDPAQGHRQVLGPIQRIQAAGSLMDVALEHGRHVRDRDEALRGAGVIDEQGESAAIVEGEGLGREVEAWPEHPLAAARDGRGLGQRGQDRPIGRRQGRGGRGTGTRQEHEPGGHGDDPSQARGLLPKAVGRSPTGILPRLLAP